jgi:hypothetical protein
MEAKAPNGVVLYPRADHNCSISLPNVPSGILATMIESRSHEPSTH